MSNETTYDTAISTEETIFLQIINITYQTYFKYGARSPKKVNYFHSNIKEMLVPLFPKNKGYDIKLEVNIPSCNSSERKKCDIVIFKDNIPYMILPVKICMTNFKQNKNNSWENLTGELCHLKWENPTMFVIPINIFMDTCPYLNKHKKITKFEKIDINDVKQYEKLIHYNICNDMINYIVHVEHLNKINEGFDTIHPITKINTEYRPFSAIFSPFL